MTEEVTREEMQAHEDVRSSGATNMFNFDMVAQLAETNYGVRLSRKSQIYIIEHYDELKKKFETKSDVIGYEIKIHSKKGGEPHEGQKKD